MAQQKSMLLQKKHRVDFFRRQHVAITEIRRKVLLSLNRQKDVHQYSLPQTKQTRCKNLCVFSGRTRGIVRYGLARQTLKTIGIQGHWIGLKKYGW